MRGRCRSARYPAAPTPPPPTQTSPMSAPTPTRTSAKSRSCPPTTASCCSWDPHHSSSHSSMPTRIRSSTSTLRSCPTTRPRGVRGAGRLRPGDHGHAVVTQRRRVGHARAEHLTVGPTGQRAQGPGAGGARTPRTCARPRHRALGLSGQAPMNAARPHSARTGGPTRPRCR